MLARFATGAPFSSDCKGGGKESNSKFLPHMIQMARHLLDQSSSSQRHTMAKAISSYLNSSPSQSSSSGTEETIQFMMVSSLLTESSESWLDHRLAFLQRGIYHAYMQHSHSRSVPQRSSSSNSNPSSTSGTSDNLLPIVQPMLVYTGLIKQLRQFFKPRKSSTGPSSSGEGTSKQAEVGDDEKGLEGWEVVMNEKLLNMKKMVGFSKEVLSWLDDMTSAGDLQEAFDVIGALEMYYQVGPKAVKNLFRRLLMLARAEANCVTRPIVILIYRSSVLGVYIFLGVIVELYLTYKSCPHRFTGAKI